ncbi:Transmembrane protein 120B [Anabarilius grahami]|uniref:Transmembrane protein 120B n=1 Tax=Anabarilius grahami TaxID=495550 RepID=A0A3N0Z6N6_ANAGA|nr:Transmembrane protein 120B [Anabarilius grahami]
MSLERCQTEWTEIDQEYQQLQETHKVYRQKLEELTNLQAICSSAISKQRKGLKDLKQSLHKCKKSCNEKETEETHKVYRQKLEELTNLQAICSSAISKQRKGLKDLKQSLHKCKKSCNEKETEVINDLQVQIKERQNVFFDMESYLPKKNGLYLNLVLGNVNVTLLSNQAKFAYKDEYEKFKLYMTIILMFGAVTCLFLMNYREGLYAVMLSSDGFVSLAGCVQFLQYYYQSGCLYRLRALGERNQLDLTVEGFQSWMWRGLTFLLPFLFFGHFWQLYNAVTLFKLSARDDCKEWQVFMLALTFLVLFLGNFLTTLKVVHQKVQKNTEKVKTN